MENKDPVSDSDQGEEVKKSETTTESNKTEEGAEKDSCKTDATQKEDNENEHFSEEKSSVEEELPGQKEELPSEKEEPPCEKEKSPCDNEELPIEKELPNEKECGDKKLLHNGEIEPKITENGEVPTEEQVEENVIEPESNSSEEPDLNSSDKPESNTSDKPESNSSDKLETNTDKPDSNLSDKLDSNSSDKPESNLCDKLESNLSDKPESDSNDKLEPTNKTEDKPENKPERPTRGRKRKAPNSETAEQKENVDSKNNDSAHKESELRVDDPSMTSLSESNIMGKGKRARIPNKRYSDILLSPNRKSTVHQKSSESSESEAIEIKEEPVDLPAISSPGLSAKKTARSIPKENLQDPKYLKPFKYGWKRELVWRSTSTQSKPLGDIYYYTPEGRKVRSFREVSDHLTSKNLTLDNFSFTKEPLGIDDPEKEIIRDAKLPKHLETVPNVTTPKKQEIKKPKKVVSPKSGGADTSKAAPKPEPVAATPGRKSGADTAKAPPKPEPVVTTPGRRGGADTSKAPPKPEPVVGTPGRRRAAAAGVSSVVEKEKESLKESPASTSKKTLKMPIRKSKTPLAKKPRLSPKDEEPMGLEVTPPARSSPAKTRSASHGVQNSSQQKLKKRNLKVKSITHTNSVGPEEKNEAKFMENYLQNLSFGYNTLLYVFQYLKVQDLLRAGCVCTMWRDIASHPILWRTVRMKNSQVHSFEGLANTLKKHGTVHLDLRKMLLPSNGEDIWPEFSKAIARVDTLRKIELCRCPATVVEQLAVSNPNLEVINAVTIRCESMNLDPFSSLNCIRELRLKSTLGLNVNSIESLRKLKTLKILSLTSVTDLHTHDLNVIAELTNLESLDLGECTDLPKNFGQDILLKLEKLEKLRLEKGQGNCHTFEILDAVKNMKSIEQLELVNFDVKSGFDKALGACTNIRKLMIIPTYISQSATTNNMVLSGVLRLQGNLTHFVWGVTLELLRVTELFVDQCEDSNKKDKKPVGNGDSIPVLKPVPDLSNGGAIQAASNPPQVEILPLPNLQKLLLNSLPTTRVKILKIPFHATWRQTLTDSV